MSDQEPGTTGGNLAIVTPHAGARTETFIDVRLRRLLPERTVVISFEDPSVTELDCPVLRVTPADRSHLPLPISKPMGFYNLLLHGHWNSLDRGESARLQQFLSRNGVGCVLAEYGPAGGIVARACLAADARLYVHFHGADASAKLRRWRYRASYRWLGRHVDGIIAPCRFLVKKLSDIGISERKLHVSYNPVNLERFRPSEGERDEGLLLAVGRFVEKKAPTTTIRAFSRAARERPGVRLEMIGEGELLAQCEQLAARLGVADRVIFHGARDHDFVRDKMQKAAVFVQHSVTAPDGDTEGLPNSILESMASGLPVLATRHAGIPEAVTDGETGLLVDEHDEAGMAVAIERLLDNPTLRQQLSEAARNYVERNHSMEKRLRILRQILKIKPPE
jgi:glycosyltransferase involved in cell wall biosynthesis